MLTEYWLPSKALYLLDAISWLTNIINTVRCVETYKVYTIACVWTNKTGNIVVTSGNLLCYVVLIDKFIFSPPAIKTSYLKSEDFSRKPIASSTSEFLDSTDRNYYAKLWAKLSSKKSPVVRVGQVGYIIIETYSIPG